ncbi:MAG: DUF4339 domain-containing protein [Akkermansiaceae bacterium]|nr:DUF4339 domain-containing protein [Akkermansiaceae bacterium]
MMLQLVIGLVLGGVTSAIAASKGRNAVGWFFLGFFFGCVSLIIILCLSNLKEEQAYRQTQLIEQQRLREQLRQEQMKTEALRRHTVARLDAHDQHLGIDTRQTAPALGPGNALSTPQALPSGLPQQQQIQHPATGWYVCYDGSTQEGPMSFEEVRQQVWQGRINAETLVWVETMTGWQAARTVPGLLPS